MNGWIPSDCPLLAAPHVSPLPHRAMPPTMTAPQEYGLKQSCCAGNGLVEGGIGDAPGREVEERGGKVRPVQTFSNGP